MRLFFSWVAVCFVFWVVHPMVLGQSDLFGDDVGNASEGLDLDPGTPQSRDAKQAEPPSVNIFEKNAVVVALQKEPPRTHAELARAIKLMARIQRWDEVSRWIQATEKLGLNESTAASMLKEAGGAVFQSLLSPNAELGANERKVALSIIELANRYRQNPTTIAAFVNAMRSNDRQQRLQGFLGVQSAGNLGIASFLQNVMANGASPPTPIMCEALSKLSTPAKEAWIAAMSTPHEDARLNLLRLGLGARDRDLVPVLRSWLAAPPAGDGWSELHQQWVLTYGNVDFTLSRERSLAELEAQLSKYQDARWEDEVATSVCWRLGNDGRSLSPVEGRPADHVWRALASAATNLVASSEIMKTDAALATAIQIQDRLITVGSLDGVSNRKLLDRHEYVCLVWDVAAKQDFAHALKYATENLSRFTDPMPVEVRDRLVAALDSGHRGVRYAAASGLLNYLVQESERGNTQGSFHGRSKLDRVVAEMAQLSSKPIAMVLGGSTSLRTHVGTMLQEFGYDIDEQSNSNSAMSRLKNGMALDAIFVVSSVRDSEMGQLLNRCRSTPAGATVPIVILADSLSSGTHAFAAEDRRVVLGSIPAESSGLVDLLSRARMLSQSAPLDDAEQIAWKDQALRFRESAIQRLVVAQRLPVAQPVLDTPIAQSALLDQALDRSRPLPEREQASQLFVQSIRQFGLLLSTETADAQYDVYNDRGRREPETREILGRILDAIEASRGKRD